MRFLLDTHVAIWWLEDSDRLSDEYRRIIADVNELVFLSAISFAEIEIKRSLGTLEMSDAYREHLKRAQFETLPFATEHSVALRTLPFIHRDPFDRMLIAQAITEGLALMTADPNFRRYDVAVV